MAYSITTQDGITIQNIPDNIPPDAPELKQRVASIRAGTAKVPEKSGAIAEGGKGLVRGAVNAVGQILDTPQNIYNLGQAAVGSVMGMAGAPADSLPQVTNPNAASRFINEQLARVANVQPSPDGPVAQMVGTGAEILGSSLNQGRLGMNAAAAVGGALGEQVGGEWGKVIGAVGAPLAASGARAAVNVPRNAVAGTVNDAMSQPFATEGVRDSIRQKIPLTLAQTTGNRGQLIMEGVARRNPVTAQQFSEFENKTQLPAAVNRLKQIMSNLGPGPASPARFGVQVNDAFDDVVNKAVTSRRAQATADFGAVKELSGGKPIIPTKNLAAEIKAIVDDFDAPLGGDASAELAEKAKALLRQITQQGEERYSGFSFDKPITREPGVTSLKNLTATEAERLLEIYGKASAGKGAIFKDLDTAQQRSIGGRLVRALLSDLDEAAKNPDAGKAAEALLTARQNYATGSKRITEVEESVIGRFLGGRFDKDPYKIADFVMKQSPTELAQTFSVLNKSNPDLIIGARKLVLQNALESAEPAASQQVAGGAKFSPSKFVSALPDERKMAILFGSSNEAANIRQTVSVLERIKDRAGTDGSPTAPLMMAFDLAKGLFTLNPRAVVGVATGVLTPKAIAAAALTPKGRAAIMTLSKTDIPKQEAARAAAYLLEQDQ